MELVPRQFNAFGVHAGGTGQSRRIGRQFIDILSNLALITAGSVICAVAINGILLPQKFLATGFAGMALMVHYLFPSLPVSLSYILLNIPVFIIGWVYVGRRFLLYSLAGLFIFSFAMEWIQVTIPMHDKLLSALLGGIISGIGGGILLRSLGSAGGLDILSVILMKQFSIRIGTSVLAFNTILLFAISFYFSVEAALYALIFSFVSSKIVNLVVTGLSQRKSVMIISPQWDEIAREIMTRMNRGVTAIGGEGMYTGRQLKILYTVVTFQDVSRLKDKIRRIDPDALVVFSDTMEVMGRGIGNQPHW
jgi:uncharacterized membrane-anchored protein YitT (DUF2179 family)